MRSLIIIFILMATVGYSQQLFEIPLQTSARWSTFENRNGPKGKGAKENEGAKGHAFDIIQPNRSTALLDIKGAGIINRIWLTVNYRSPRELRSMRIEMYRYDEKTPAVSAPLGDFFGIGLGRTAAFESEFFSDPEGRSFNCYIPMPYRSSARIVIYNVSAIPVTLYYDVDYQELSKREKPVYYFHCYWSRENKTKLSRDFLCLPEVKGRGRFLGMNVGVIADTVYGHSWWGEGEVKMYLDNDSEFPTIAGTGTEDHIGTAWGQGKIANRFQGCSVADEKNRQWAFYRYHVPDPIYFQRNCKVALQQIGGEKTEYVRTILQKGAVLEPVTVTTPDKIFKLLEESPVPDIHNPAFPQGWTNFYREDDVFATAYFYLDKPFNALPAIAPVKDRIKGLSGE